MRAKPSGISRFLAGGLLFLLFLILLLVLFREFLFSSATIYARDSSMLEIPMRKLGCQLLKEGHFALWTDAYGNGQPFMANPKNAVFYPTTWLYLIFPLFTAFKLHYLIHIFICWSGIYFLARAYDLSQQSSFLAASLFIFSGIYLSSLEFYNYIAALSWMPWVLFILIRPFRSFLSKLLLLSLLITLLLLSGTPFVVMVTGILGLLQSLILRRRRPGQAFFLICGFVMAVLVSSVQFFPSAELLTHAHRDLEARTDWPLEGIQLMNLGFPGVFGHNRDPAGGEFWGGHLFDKGHPLFYSLYFGFGVLILFFLGFRRPLDRRRVVFILGFFLFVLLSLGRYSLFFPWLQKLPLFSSLRYPMKFFLGACFCLVMLSAFGFEAFFREEKASVRRLAGWLVFALFATGGFYLFQEKIISALGEFFVINRPESLTRLAGSLGTGLLMLNLSLGILFLSRTLFRRRALFAWSLMLLILVDLLAAGRKINPVIPQAYMQRNTAVDSEVKPIYIYRQDRLPFDALEEMGRGLDRHLFLYDSRYPFSGVGDWIRYMFNEDFFQLYSRYYTALIELIETCPPEVLLKLLQASGCSYYFGPDPLPALPAEVIKISGQTIHFQKINGSRPSPRLVFSAVSAHSAGEAFSIFSRESFDPRKAAIIPGDVSFVEEKSLHDAGFIKILDEYQGGGEYSAETAKRAVAIFPGNYFVGWRAWVNGEKTRLFPVNLASKGLILPPGRSDIRLEYSPRSFRIGIVVSLAALGLFYGLLPCLVFLFRRSRKI